MKFSVPCIHNVKETIAVGMATFTGSIDLIKLQNNKPQHPRLLSIASSRMNKNEAVKSSLSITMRIADVSDSLASQDGETPTAILTLYASRFDVKVKRHILTKGRAMNVVINLLDSLGCSSQLNEKTGSVFTVTLHSFGNQCKTMEEVTNEVTRALDEAGDIEGVLLPAPAKLHLTGCRTQEEIHECAETFYAIFKSHGDNFNHVHTYNIMCNSTYRIANTLHISSFVKTIASLPQFADICVVYDNTRDPNKVLLIFTFDVTAHPRVNDEAWRDNFEVTLTIKNNGKVDQSSFSKHYSMIVQERLCNLLSYLPVGTFS